MTDQPIVPGPGQTPPPQPPLAPAYPSYPTDGGQPPQAPGPGNVPPGYGPPAGYGPGPGGIKPPSKTLAIIALVCAVLGFLVITWIAAIVLAIIVLAQLRSGRQGGKGLAISALVICALYAAGFIALIVYAVSTSATRDDDGVITKAGSLTVTDLRKGDCITEDPDKDTVYNVDVAPCDEPHLFEVYAVEKLPGDDFPGKAKAIQLSQEACTAAQAGFNATSPATLTPSTIYPTEESWEDNQEAICLVSTGKKVTGSLGSD